MKAHPHPFRVVLSLVALSSFGAPGCLCPPCGPPPGTVQAVGAGARLVVWDGDSEGPTAGGWPGCSDSASCVEVKPGIGVNGSNGLRFHVQGSEWIGMGWNLFGWYPPDSGYDLSPYTHLTFQIRVEAKTAADAPEPGGVTLFLASSKNSKFASASVPIEKYAKGFTDGKWHKVSIPLAAFQQGAGAKFDMQSFWELHVSTWSGATHNCDIILDDFVAERH